MPSQRSRRHSPRSVEHHLFLLATAVNRADSLAELYEHALDAITKSIDVRRASILLLDDKSVMRFTAWRGLSATYRSAVEGHSPWKPDDVDPHPIAVADVRTAELPPQLKDVIEREDIRALAFIPLTYGGRLIGKFMVYFDQPHTMTRADIELALAIAQTLAVGIERQKAEDRLRQSESQLRLALEAGRMGSWEWDIASNTVSWSPALERIHGREVGSFGGSFESFQQDIHPDDRDRVLTSIANTLKQGTHLHVEYRIVLPDNSIQWVEGKGALYQNEDGVPQRMVGVCANITERKQAEEMITAKEQWLRLAQAVGKVGIFHWDLTSRRTSCSDEFFTVMGMRPNTAQEVCYEEWSAQAHPEDIARVIQEFERAIQEVGTCGSEYRMVGVDGRTRWISYRGQVFADAAGKVTHMIGTVQDVTELKESQRTQAQLAARLQRITESGVIGILYWDLDGSVLEANDTFLKLIGYTREDLAVGTVNWKALTPPEWSSADAHGLACIRRDGKVDPFEKEYIHKNGHRVPILISGTLLEGDSRLGVSLVLDITERKRSEERSRTMAADLENRVQARTCELLQSQAQLRQLASELNLAEQRERKRLAAQLHDHLQQTLVLGKMKVGQARRTLQAVPECLPVITQFDNLLTEALGYTRTLVSELSPTVLRDHGLAAGLKWLGEYMKRHDMAVSVTVPDEIPRRLPEDQEVLLFQSVRELLINAAKHAQTDMATIVMEQQLSHIRIEVIDAGKGFDPTLASPTSDLSSGFGLFSIRERMKALGGSFEIVSAPGHGTRSILTLPLETPTQSPEIGRTPLPDIPRQRAKAAATSSSALRLLLVDDHAMMREGLRTVLEGYPDLLLVGEAKDGEEAIQLVERLHPQVVIMDINMPKLNGIEATKRIKDSHRDICVVGLSVNADAENQEAMTRAGAAVLITKETVVDELYQAIRRALQQEPATRPPRNDGVETLLSAK